MHGIPLGIGLAPEIDSNMTALAMLYAFGASVQDADNRPTLQSKEALDALTWTTHLGYPGSTNAAIDEIFNTWLLSSMFAQAATGKLSPEEALHQVNTQVQGLFQK